MQAIEQELRQFIIDNIVFDESIDLRDTDSFLDRGIIDSTGILELISFLEQRYGVSLEEGELVPQNLDSISGIANLIRRKTESQPAALAASREQTA